MKKNLLSGIVQSLLPITAVVAMLPMTSQFTKAQSLVAHSTWEYFSNQGTGHSVTQAGDINGDGYNDIVVGNPQFSNGQTSEGLISVFYGSSSGFDTAPGWTAEGNLANANLGWTVSAAGDINNDGYSDVVAGAPGANSNKGAIFIYYGSASGPASTPVTIHGTQAGEKFGFSIVAQDINNDGYKELYVGAPYYSNGTNFAIGKVYAFTNTASGISSTSVWSMEGNGQKSGFGWSLAIGTVTSATGTNQKYNLIIGAPGTDGTVVAYVVLTDTLPTPPNEPPVKKLVMSDSTTSSRFGFSVAIAGDINDDGYEDIIVGAPMYNNGQGKEGRVTIYNGGNVSSTPVWSAVGNSTGTRFGYSVLGKGNVNSDSYEDIAITAPGSQGHNLVVYTGTATGFSNPQYSLTSLEAINSIAFYQPNSSAVTGLIAGIPSIVSGVMAGNGTSKYIREFEDILTRRGAAHASGLNSEMPQISLYPNPAIDNLTFTIASASPVHTAKIELVNLLGVTVLTLDNVAVTGGKVTIDLPSLSAGIYYAAVQISGQTSFMPVQISK
jgi:hypothetical protein